jgi:hypothetical protein
VQVKAGIVQPVVKVIKLTASKHTPYLADDSRSILDAQTEQVTDATITAPVGKNVFDRDVESTERCNTIEVPALSVQVDVNRSTVAFVKHRPVVLEHTPQRVQGIRHRVEWGGAAQYILSVVKSTQRTVVDVLPHTRNVVAGHITFLL